MLWGTNGKDSYNYKFSLNREGRKPTSFSALSFWFSSFTEFTLWERSETHTNTLRVDKQSQELINLN